MPVYSSHLAQDYHSLGVSLRIREARQNAGFALRRFAQLTGISQAQLSNIETGKAPLNIAQLVKIANALNQPVTALLPRTAEFPYFITRRERIAAEAPRPIELLGPERRSARSHNFSWPLAEPFLGKRMFPGLAQIHPLANDDLQLIGHHHEEFIFVLGGEVENLIKTNTGFATEILGPGDCLYLRSYLPHCHRSNTSEPAQILSVSYSRRGAFDFEDDELSDPGGAFFYRRSYRADIANDVTEKIVLLRRSKRLSINELAERLDIGIRQLVSIERGTKSPEFDLLLRLAREFKRPVEYFLEESSESGPSYFVLRHDEVPNAPTRRRLQSGKHGSQNVFRSLAAGFPGRGIFPSYVEMKGTTEEQASQHIGQEFVYILSGEVELAVLVADEEKTEVLRPGDTLFLDSSANHLLKGRPHSPYARHDGEALVVFWSPLGENALFE